MATKSLRTVIVVESFNGVSVSTVPSQLRLVASPEHFAIPIRLAVAWNGQKRTSCIDNGCKGFIEQKISDYVGI